MTGLMTAPGWGDFKPPEGGAAAFSGVLSADMAEF
jgi:hypothetical protein